MKHFYGSFIIAIIGIGIAFFIGGLEAAYITFLLSLLEVSLSFDNAVVNAKVLKDMSPKWQHRFLTWGMVIAVFGMRFLFPILIVMVVSGLGLIDTVQLALKEPLKYSEILSTHENLIYAFGASFLLMVFWEFLFDEEKEVNWIKPLEDNIVTNKLKQIENIGLIITISIGIYLTYLLQDYKIAIAFFLGMLINALLNSLDGVFNTNGVRNGLMGLIYLEVLDASFSFDGVIGAFAISTDVIIIMLGLGIGAMFVRSLTLYLVEKGTLSEYKYLEHGAHYAILVLALIMILNIHWTHVSDIVTGTIGIALIGIAFLHSYIENKRDKA